MLANEALNILGLKPGATQAEIKEAYRDLVKVWHPDRFVGDPSLRQKAEDKLKRLNHAYQSLRHGYATDSDASDSPPPPPPPANSYPSNRTARSSWHGMRSRLWLYASLAMLLMALAVYAVRQNKPDEPAIHSAPPAAQHSVPSSGTQAQRNTHAGKRTAPTSAPMPAPFTIRTLSNADTARLESACGSLRDQPDTSAYQTCLKVQLAAINSHSAPDLTGLSDAERASIEHACAGAKARGPSSYNSCAAHLVKLLGDSR